MPRERWDIRLMSLARTLPHAVNSWLTFEYMCEKSALFSESYLAKPIGDYLSVKAHGELELEYDHDILKSLDRGRNAQVDYVVHKNGSKNIALALEIKWFKKEHKNQIYPRILNDALRLRLLQINNRNAQFYFLLSGLRDDMDVFDNSKLNKDIFSDKIIKFKMYNYLYKNVNQKTKDAIDKNNINNLRIKKFNIFLINICVPKYGELPHVNFSTTPIGSFFP